MIRHNLRVHSSIRNKKQRNEFLCVLYIWKERLSNEENRLFVLFWDNNDVQTAMGLCQFGNLYVFYFQTNVSVDWQLVWFIGKSTKYAYVFYFRYLRKEAYGKKKCKYSSLFATSIRFPYLHFKSMFNILFLPFPFLCFVLFVRK